MLFRRAARQTVRAPRRRLGVEVLEAREVLSAALPYQVLEVHQGDPHARFQTIQAAVNAAHPGDEVRIFSGTYQESVTVSTPNLTIDGAPGARVRLVNPGGAQDGITAAGPGYSALNGFTLANVQVSNFGSYGVYLIDATNFTLSRVTADNNAVDGIYAVLSSRGSIDRCTASGSSDIGIYVGQSSGVVVSNNVVYNNLNGIEEENVSNVHTVNNLVFGNTTGIELDQLPAVLDAIPPFKPVQAASNNVVSYNKVFANNRPNLTAPDPLAALEVPGTGILLIGGNHTEVSHNDIFANGYTGIILLAGTNLLPLAPSLPPYSAGFDGVPRNTTIEFNKLHFNGFLATPPGYPAAADLIWTGTGTNNHWSHNQFDTSTPGMLP
jgi:parallel beta-helix repeat protein